VRLRRRSAIYVRLVLLHGRLERRSRARARYGALRWQNKHKTFSLHQTEPTDTIQRSELVLEISDGRVFAVDQRRTGSATATTERLDAGSRTTDPENERRTEGRLAFDPPVPDYRLYVQIPPHCGRVCASGPPRNASTSAEHRILYRFWDFPR
jgi:hypothetical protein